MKWTSLLLAAAFAWMTPVVRGDDSATRPKLTLNHMELPFHPAGLRVSPDGRFAVCWGAAFDSVTERGPAGRGKKQYAVLDIEKGAVVSKQVLNQEIDAMHVDKDFVYLVLQTTTKVTRSSHKSTKVVDEMIFEGSTGDLAFLPSGELAVWHFGQGWEIRVHDPKTLKRVPHPLERKPREPYRRLSERVHRVAHGLSFEDGVLWDVEGKTIQCLIGAAQLAAAFPEGNAALEFERLVRSPRWERFVSLIELTSARGERIAVLRPFMSTVLLLDQTPLIVGVARKPGQNFSLELIVREAKTGQVLEAVPLAAPKPGKYWNFAETLTPVIVEASDRVLVGHPGGVAMFHVPAAWKSQAKVPLHLKAPKIGVGRTNAPLQFDMTAAGGAAGKTFVLVNESPGLAIDAGTGRVTVDGKTLWMGIPQTNPEAIAQLVETRPDFVEFRAAEFERVTGQKLKPEEIPLQVKVTVGVSDEEKAYDELTVYAILVATKRDLAQFAPKRTVAEEATDGVRELDGYFRRLDAAFKRLEILGRPGAAPEKRIPPELEAEIRRRGAIKKLVIAFHNHHETYGAFPGAGRGGKDNSKKGLSWRVHLLPFLGEKELYQQFHLDEPWDSLHNKTLVGKMPDLFRSLGVEKPGMTSLHVFTGKGAPFAEDRAPRIPEFTDGTSKTLLAVEAGPDKADVWTKPGGLDFQPAKPIEALGELADDTFLSVLADGSVRAIARQIDAKTLRRMIEFQDGEPLP